MNSSDSDAEARRFEGASPLSDASLRQQSENLQLHEWLFHSSEGRFVVFSSDRLLGGGRTVDAQWGGPSGLEVAGGGEVGREPRICHAP